MQKYYVSAKAKVILGFMFIMPYILTKISFMTIKGWLQTILKDSLVWVPNSTFDSHPIYYFYSLVFLIVSLLIVGATIARYDEQLDRFIKRVPFISKLYGIFNEFFTTKKSPKGVPLVLNPYDSPHGNLYCLIPTFEKRWLYCTQKRDSCWCYTVTFLPNGNPAGGHSQHYACEYIDEEMQLQQYGKMSFDQFISYCMSFGMTFPQDLIQKADELVPEFILKQKEQKTV